MDEQQDAESVQTFRFRPDELKVGDNIFYARTDIASLFVRVIGEGGETNLHAHTANEAVWMVVSGEATFYGEGDHVMAKLGPFDGLVVPRGTKYWFESSSPEKLVIMRFGAVDKTVADKRIDFTERRDDPTNVRVAGSAR